jgi:hypothetical protein
MIVPAAIVESVCGIALAYAAALLFRRSASARGVTIVSNVIALGGVSAGPRTATNDVYHRLMLAAIAASFFVLWTSRPHEAQRF